MGEVVQLELPPRRTVNVVIHDMGNNTFTLLGTANSGWKDEEELTHYMETVFGGWLRVQQDRRYARWEAEQEAIQAKQPWFQSLMKRIIGEA